MVRDRVAHPDGDHNGGLLLANNACKKSAGSAFSISFRPRFS